MRLHPCLAALPILASLAGCHAEYVRSHAAFDFDCPRAAVDVQSEGYSHYEASGCGQVAEFVCIRGGCVREGEVHVPERYATLGPVQQSMFDTGPARIVVSSAVGAAADACRDEDGTHGAGEARLTFTPDGRVKQVVLDERFDGSGTGACVLHRLVGTQIPPYRGGAETVDVPFFVAAAD
jgi:hypothetical protein